MPDVVVSPSSWALAVLPIAALVGLVLWSRWSTSVQALVAAALAVAIGAIGFKAGAAVLSVGIGKGLWTGVWILYVIAPALLLYHLAARAGLDRMGAVFGRILPRDIEAVLLLAWVFPSFLQGVAGFGTPIAVAAPLLVAMGFRPGMAVALPLVGYHWSVTFGSMGSSFYMASLTARLGADAQLRFAEQAAFVLSISMLAAGVLVCLLHGGVSSLRRAIRMLLVTGGAMFLGLNLAVRVEPAIGSLAAGAAGLVSVVVLRLFASQKDEHTADQEPLRERGGARPRPAVVLAPYGALLVLVLAVYLPPIVRGFVTTQLLIGPEFPATTTGLGASNPAVTTYTPIALLGHPGTYLLVASGLALFIYRGAGVWAPRSLRVTMREWSGQVRAVSLPVLALTVLATVMVDTGMVRTIAVGAAAATGAAFPAVSPLIGALGSFTTGSTTTSNALFSALQQDVAEIIGRPSAALLAAQTAGGNVGNAIAPVLILVGQAAVPGVTSVGRVIRQLWWAVLVLIVLVTATTLLLPLRSL